MESLLGIMSKLLAIHRSLLGLSVKKTDIVKKGDMAALSQLLKDEQAHVTAIGNLEKERKKITEKILPEINSPTLSEIADTLESADKEKLLKAAEELVDLIYTIKSNNEVNQQMIHQSMQFLKFSQSLLMPQPANFTYGPPTQKKTQPGKSYGMFNSRA